MPYVNCDECGAEFYQEPGQEWKKLCLQCWRLQNENGFLPSHFRNLKTALTIAESELGRRIDLAMAFKIFLPTMQDAVDRYQGPGAPRCREWLKRLSAEWEVAA